MVAGPAVAHRYVDLAGVRLHYVEAGKGPLVVLLHGFPEFWFSWRFQIPALAAAGFRVVAPDMRGYNLSDRPTGVEGHLRLPSAPLGLGEAAAVLLFRDGGDEAPVGVDGLEGALLGRDVAGQSPHHSAFRHHDGLLAARQPGGVGAG